MLYTNKNVTSLMAEYRMISDEMREIHTEMHVLIKQAQELGKANELDKANKKFSEIKRLQKEFDLLFEEAQRINRQINSKFK